MKISASMLVEKLSINCMSGSPCSSYLPSDFSHRNRLAVWAMEVAFWVSRSFFSCRQYRPKNTRVTVPSMVKLSRIMTMVMARYLLNMLVCIV